nr:4a-hydroxytetrahydrobiopterin dehydratase [Geminicoccus flavidas]
MSNPGRQRMEASMPDDPADLATRSCTPCKGGEPPLGPKEAEAYRGETPEWSLRDEARRIERSFRFKDFRQAFAFVERVAMLAEAEGHHPDISFGWGYAQVSLQTKKIKGLHANDFVMAAKIDRIAAAGPNMSA